MSAPAAPTSVVVREPAKVPAAAPKGAQARLSAWRGWQALRAAPLFFLSLGALLFALLAGAGIGIVLALAASHSAEQQVRATALVSSVATSFGAQLLGALSPSLAVATFIESGPLPAHEAVQRWFTKAAPALVAASSAIDDIQLAPYGHVASVYPLVTARRNATGILLYGDAGGGHDLFNASSSIANRRAAAILALTTQQLQIEGPKNLLSAATKCTSLCQFGQSGLLSRIPLFVTTSATADPWAQGYQWAPAPGGPPLGPFTAVTGCDTIKSAATGASLCDTNALGDGRRFWGAFTVIIVWSQLLQLAGVDALTADYKWSIARSAESSNGTGAFPWVVVGSSDGALPTSAYAAGRVSSAVSAYSSSWVFTVEPRASWVPAWQGGAIAGVVLLGALLTALVFYIALQQRVNEGLLYSMLPRRVVAKMRAGEADIAEPFEHVTLLFTDIVRFTDLVALISPHETLQMLNQLFSEFDEIAQRHGVLKLETVGDAFVAVTGLSGDAGERDPGAQALRMARCALDMVDCAARHELPTGGTMLIRVGLHCGPAVAGVVGKALPHYSVFGDVVNTCARMESSSLPGRIHVSAKFHGAFCAAAEAAAAGAGAGAPPPQPLPFFLHPRGAVAIKGKGVLQTHFLLRAGDTMSADELLGPSSPERSFVRTATAGSGGASSVAAST